MQTLRWLRENRLQVAILVVPFIVLAVFWGDFPERVVTHWGGDGRPNGWMKKAPGLLGTPLISVGVAILLGWIPRLDPRLRMESERSERSVVAIGVIRIAVTALMTLGSVLIAANALGYHFDSLRVGLNVLLLFFAVMGNYMGNIRPNYFIGVRTPWTLESDSVWRATHRFLGGVWVLGAALLLALQFTLRQSIAMPIAMGFFIGTSLLAVPYSWWRFQSGGADRRPPTAS
jgi:uncharacterized membrane protein